MPTTGAKPQGATDEASAARAVREMFDAIAPRYDLLNHLLSANVDRLWWRRAARRFCTVLANPDAAVLDICCGTGDMTMALLKRRPRGARPILAADFAREMLNRGAEKVWRWRAEGGRGVCRAARSGCAASAVALGVAGFDCVGIRVQESGQLRGGAQGVSSRAEAGRAVGILEFSEPGGLVGKAYAVYFRRVLPAIGRAICGKDGPYNYLPTSVGNFPAPEEMLGLMSAAGYEQCAWQPYTFGIAGLYTARRGAVA
jgi:demethylmenaquinone methyltransferase/2-methoxy-6-polyprenyl-1,4-benzoquinol methylase